MGRRVCECTYVVFCFILPLDVIEAICFLNQLHRNVILIMLVQKNIIGTGVDCIRFTILLL